MGHVSTFSARSSSLKGLEQPSERTGQSERGRATAGMRAAALIPILLSNAFAFRAPFQHDLQCGSLRTGARSANAGLCGRTRGRVVVMQQTGMKPGGFDLVSGKDFDLLSLRSYRREAKLRYSNLNQSEPLRIFIFGTLAVIAAAAGLQDIFGELDTSERALSIVTSITSAALFLRERSRRTAQLVRMDRECAISDLGVSFTDAMTGATNKFEVRQLRNKLRLLVVYGDKATLKKAIQEAAVFRRRFVQSEVAFLAVSSDGSERTDWNVPENARGGWLWEAQNAQDWRDYLEEILATKKNALGKGAWLTLNKKGRSRGSGLGAPRFDELLGSRLPPTQDISQEDSPNFTDLDKSVLSAQAAFYGALTSGDLEAMQALWCSTDTSDVSEFLSLGGRLDPWQSQLRDGARPEGMRISSRDVLVSDSRDEAWSTCLEMPAASPGTLLATQHWVRTRAADGVDVAEEPAWKLMAHRTIPFSVNAGALATLRCDCRGCVAGIRELDKQGPLDMPDPARR